MPPGIELGLAYLALCAYIYACCKVKPKERRRYTRPPRNPAREKRSW
jgi:hypothetical protein